MSYTRKQLEQWLREIDVKCDRCLDIGGSQLSIRGRTKSWEVKDYKILDLDQPHECKQEPDLVEDIQEVDFSKYHKDWKGFFDIVFCLEVSEYWIRPLQALNNVNIFLKKGGLFYSSWHFIYPTHNPEGKDYLRYTKWGVERLLKETGFEIEEMVPRMAKNPYKMEDWFRDEKMRPSRTFNGHHQVGYLVKCRKV